MTWSETYFDGKWLSWVYYSYLQGQSSRMHTLFRMGSFHFRYMFPIQCFYFLDLIPNSVIYAKSTFLEPKCPFYSTCIFLPSNWVFLINSFHLPLEKPFPFLLWWEVRWMNFVASEDGGEERTAWRCTCFHSFVKDTLGSAALSNPHLHIHFCEWVSPCRSVFQNTPVKT